MEFRDSNYINSDRKNLSLDATNTYMDPPKWVVQECSILCTEIYSSDVYTSLQKHKSQSKIRRFCLSDNNQYDGKIMMAEAIDPITNKEFVFVVFRGTDNTSDFLVDLNVSATLTPTGLVHSGFFERSISLPLDFLFNICSAGKTLIITGHSLGGACATILTSRLITEKVHHSFHSNLYCITFGSPLIGEKDIIPRILAVKKSLQKLGAVVLSGNINALFSLLINYKPAGSFHLLKFKDNTSICVTMSEEEAKSHFFLPLDSSVLSDSVTQLIQHSMIQYCTALKKSGLFDILYITDEHSSVIEKELYVPVPKPTICFISGTIFEIKGKELGLVTICHISDQMIKIDPMYSSDSSIRFNLFFSLESYLAEGTIRLILLTFFGGPFELLLPIRDFPNHYYHNTDIFPNKIIRSILPLTALLGNVNNSEGEDTTTNKHFNKKIKELSYHLNHIINSIPIEFAFHILTKQLDSPLIMKNLQTLLVRMAEIQILDWKKLVSSYMIDILAQAIDNLQNLPQAINEDIIDLEFRLNRAFSNNFHVHADKFKTINSIVSASSGNKVYITQQYESVQDYFSFVCTENVSVALFFNHEDTSNTIGLKSKSFSFKKPFTIYDTSGSKCLFLIEPIKSESHKSNQVNKSKMSKIWHYILNKDEEIDYIFEKKYLITPFDNDEEHRVLTILEIILDDNGSHQLTSGLDDRVAHLLKQCFDSIDENQVINIHIHNKPSLPVSTLFSFILYENESTDSNTLKKVIHQFKVELSQYKLSKKNVDFAVDTVNNLRKIVIMSSPLKSSSVRSLFGKKKSPRKYVINVLKSLLYLMKSHFTRVGAPLFCGLSIQMDVMNKNGELEQFFSLDSTNCIDSVNLTKSASVTSNEEVSCSDTDIYNFADILIEQQQLMITSVNRVCNSLEFLSLMLDEIILVSKSKMFKTFETKREKTIDIIGNALLAVASLVPTTIYGAVKALEFGYTWDFQNIVDVEDKFYSLWHSITYRGNNFESYKHMIYFLTNSLDLKINDNPSLRNMEDVLYNYIPKEIEHLNFEDLTKRAKFIFKDTKFNTLLNDRSIAVHMFILKIIFHCHKILELRKSLLLVTINGQKNTGKSTLLKKLVGKNSNGVDIVKSKEGINPENTTVYPMAYSDSIVPCLTYIDLPGCTDKETIAIPTLFSSSSDISIFMLWSREASNPTGSLFSIIEKFMKMRNGPSLLCINGFDVNLENCFEESELKQTLVICSKKWRCSKLFNDICNKNESNELIWDVEKERKLSHSVILSVREDMYSPYPLSIWFSSLQNKNNNCELVAEFLFDALDIKKWIFEVKELIYKV